MTRTKPLYVLGTGLSHDGSVCLLKDGEIFVAIEKERITRQKHDGGNDAAAINYVLKTAGITLSDLALVVQNAYSGMLRFNDHWYEGERPFKSEVPILTISHHLAHAYSIFATSPFDDSAILIIDGCGNSFDDCMDLEGAVVPEVPSGEMAPLWNEKDSYYKTAGTKVIPLFKDFSPWGTGIKGYPMHPPTTRHSIGGVYGAASKYVFRGLEDPGKLMGLAPYGRPGAFNHEVFNFRDGRVFVRYDWMEHFQTPAHSHEDFKSRFQHYADLALGIQREVERALLYVAHARHALDPQDNLCYSGGVALNAVANRRLLTEGPFKRVHITPAAGDNGLALGCAYYGWLEILKKEKGKPSGSVYFGKSYAPSEIETTLARYGELVDFTHSQTPVVDAISHLVDSKVVGWFQGRSEFGPRALGNRSILADPRISGIRDHINANVKFREDFRPFAPSVLAEDSTIYFDCDVPSPHMLLTAPVRAQWRKMIPAVVHLDHSARIQTVTRDSNPLFYELLEGFKRATGIGILLNTSLNQRGMPIVETPEEALLLFIYTAIDILAVGDYVVSKPPDFASRMKRFSTMVAQQTARNSLVMALKS